jgi:integrase
VAKQGSTRRQRGEGTIRRRPNGRGYEWRGWCVPESGGERARISLYAPSAAALLEKVNAIRGTITSSPPSTGEGVSVWQMLSSWLESIQPGKKTIGRRGGIRAGTWERYENIARLHLTPLHKVELSRLTTPMIDATIAGVKGSPRVKEMTGQVLRTALSWAVRKEIILKNPAIDATLPEVPRRSFPPFNIGDVARMLEAVRDHPLEALYVLALMTGARLGELLALTDRDVFLGRDRRSMHVPMPSSGKYLGEAAAPQEPGAPDFPAIVISKTLTWRPDGPFFGAIKTASAGGAGNRRVVPLSKTSVDALQRHFERRSSLGLQPEALHDVLAEIGWADNAKRPAPQRRGRAHNARLQDLIFTTSSGLPFRHSGGSSPLVQWKAIVKAHNLPSTTFHGLRHIAASTMLASNGGDLWATSQIIGHSDTRMLQKTYGHLLNAGADTINSLEALIGGAVKAGKKAPGVAKQARKKKSSGVLRGKPKRR